MKAHKLVGGCGLGLLSLGLVACGSTPVASSDVVAPMELNDGQRSAWQYLVSKYDANLDGQVTEDECNRDNFKSLDRNGDGVLTMDDYGAEDNMRAVILDGRARSAIFAYFQADEEAGTLEREELIWSFRQYDADLNDQVSEAEFMALAESRKIEIPAEMALAMGLLGDEAPWPTLIERMDANGDQRLAESELGGFFDECDNGDGTLEFESPAGEMEMTGEPASGPKFGTLAPDFELSPPAGGKAVKLSSFRGVKPVALIFGSYT